MLNLVEGVVYLIYILSSAKWPNCNGWGTQWSVLELSWTKQCGLIQIDTLHPFREIHGLKKKAESNVKDCVLMQEKKLNVVTVLRRDMKLHRQLFWQMLRLEPFHDSSNQTRTSYFSGCCFQCCYLAAMQTIHLKYASSFSHLAWMVTTLARFTANSSQLQKRRSSGRLWGLICSLVRGRQSSHPKEPGWPLLSKPPPTNTIKPSFSELSLLWQGS